MTVDSLDALRDVHLPPAPDWWSTPEWLFAAAVLVLLAVLWIAYRRTRQRALRAALLELTVIEYGYKRHNNAARLAGGLSQLVRRYALVRYPQAGIEGLTGTAWLEFLDAHGGNGAFCCGVGAVLAELPYQAGGDIDAEALIALVRRWLKANRL